MATAPTAPTAMTGIVENLQALATSLDELHLLEGNPRVGDVGAVAASLARFGQRKPIVARTDGTVIARYQQATGDKPIAEATGRPHDFDADR